MAVEHVSSPAGHPAATGDVPVVPVAGRRISWGAVLAGVIIILTIQLLLSLLGVGVGASTIDPVEGATPEGQTLGIGAGIWWVISSLIAVFAGSFVAGRLANVPVRMDGMLNGLVTWGLATLVLIYFLTTAVSGLVGGAFGVLGSALQATGQAAGTVAQTGAQTPQGQDALSRIQGQIQQMFNQYEEELRQAGEQVERAAQDPRAREVLQRAVTEGPDSLTPADREAAIGALQDHAGMTRPEAEQQLVQWEQAYREAEQTAREVGERAANTIAQASLWSFVAFALGAVVAAVGGMLGTPATATSGYPRAHARR
jgi:hypothetical protein